MTATTERTRTRTPWGIADAVTRFADDLEFYSTPRHGGFRVTGQKRRTLRQRFPHFTPFTGSYTWWEEDQDAAAVIASFPEYFERETVETCRQVLQDRADYFHLTR